MWQEWEGPQIVQIVQNKLSLNTYSNTYTLRSFLNQLIICTIIKLINNYYLYMTYVPRCSIILIMNHDIRAENRDQSNFHCNYNTVYVYTIITMYKSRKFIAVLN